MLAYRRMLTRPLAARVAVAVGVQAEEAVSARAALPHRALQPRQRERQWRMKPRLAEAEEAAVLEAADRRLRPSALEW